LENEIRESDHQRLAGETGRKLEHNVRKILNSLLEKKDIKAFSVEEIMRYGKVDGSYNKLLDYIMVPVKNSCRQEQKMTLPDTDILVVYRQEDKVAKSRSWHPLCIISCKASFHSRETETTFWSTQVRPTKVKFVCVTEDADRYVRDKKGRQKDTELKTCDNPNKIRTLLEGFCDRTYIIKKYGKKYDIVKDIDAFYSVLEQAEAQNFRGITSRIFDDFERKPHAGYCDNVRPFDDLLFDIMHWKFEKLRI
jgi:hypothetical protein